MSRNAADDPFYTLTDEEMEKYAGKWIAAYQGKIRGVGRTLDAAWRRAGLPEGAEPYVLQIPTREIWLL